MTIAMLMANTLVAAYRSAGEVAAAVLIHLLKQGIRLEQRMPETLKVTRTFAFLLVDKFPMFSLAAAIDTMRTANRMSEEAFYSWTHRFRQWRSGDRFERSADQCAICAGGTCPAPTSPSFAQG